MTAYLIRILHWNQAQWAHSIIESAEHMSRYLCEFHQGLCALSLLFATIEQYTWMKDLITATLNIVSDIIAVFLRII